MDTAKNYPTCAKPQTLDADDKQAPQSSRLSHHPSSRMFRVSRASGGKDRHSKVYTSKGLRDRRIRLSINTAIQFYDLQERLGFDQPSKAIEWLIKAAESAIAELPSLECTFPMIGSDVREAEPSSNSETSKGSVLSLSRYENGGKGKENGGNMKSEGSFTRLLTSGSGSGSGSGFGLNVASAGSGDYLRSGYSSASEMQQFAFLQEQYCPDAGGIYNLNFSMSPGVSGFHRGTLQSNSPSNHNHHHHHHQEPFLFSAAASATAASPSERPYSAGFNGHLQLCDGYEEIELKGKGKS